MRGIGCRIVGEMDVHLGGTQGRECIHNLKLENSIFTPFGCKLPMGIAGAVPPDLVGLGGLRIWLTAFNKHFSKTYTKFNLLQWVFYLIY